MATRKWIPKKIIKCSMCNNNHGRQYDIVEFGLWWVYDDETAYVNYDLCSICFTVLNELWPQETKLVKDFPRNKNRKFIEMDYVYPTDNFDYKIKKNAYKYQQFTEHRTQYINKLHYKNIDS